MVDHPCQAWRKPNLQAVVHAFATQYPDGPQPTLAELSAIARNLEKIVSPDGSFNHDAPIPTGTPSVPKVTYDDSGIKTSEHIVEIPHGDDAGLHTINGSVKSSDASTWSADLGGVEVYCAESWGGSSA
ncbi:hypothetical protein WAI453_013483 [Rhynchosporium graminicola]|uniref:Uncharacterized protein n=1 Tax=Rhynchosporium graminicola TaxID=2792576 RepID=A0A1E1K9V5_9HELO|nr:uncharacterized protein RCO7_06516 [Rhynchosporium commune]